MIKPVTLLAVLAVLAAPAARAASMEMDSSRGARLFSTLDCIECHSVNGRGGKLGPDLGKRIDRDFTPATLAATMWNHAPTMWSAMKERSLAPGNLDEQGAADLYAYFYSAHFFDKPGDAARGKLAFEQKHCEDCHGLTAAKFPGAKPPAQWEAAGDPIALANAMWTHAATMQAEFAKRKFRWPSISAQELTDLVLFVRNIPSARSLETPVRIESAGGEELFKARCEACHTGKLDLPPLLKHATLTDIAAAMWNHEPKMAQRSATGQAPYLKVDDMRKLLGYVWAREFFEDSGNASRGARVFADKRCVTCHATGTNGAPPLPAAGREFSGPAMVAALWHHGPKMLEQMESNHVPWPRFDGTQMADVIAYLNGGANAAKRP